MDHRSGGVMSPSTCAQGISSTEGRGGGGGGAHVRQRKHKGT